MKKVVIIGGGFAGMSIAKKLDEKFEVVLIDDKEYFEFTPSILRGIIEPKIYDKIRIYHKDYLKKGMLIVGRVKKLDKKEAVLESGGKEKFDYCIICSGSVYGGDMKGKGVFRTGSGKDILDSKDEFEKAKSVAIVGGGIVGVELAAEICNFGKEILIIQSRKKLIVRNKEKAVKYVENYLRKKGVDFIFGERIVERKGKYCITNKGNRLKIDLVYLCVGGKPSSGFVDKKFLDERGFVKVDGCLRVIGEKNVFAAGDVTDIMEEKMAYNSEEHAVVIVDNIIALENGRKLQNYMVGKKMMIISLGKYDGVFELGDKVLTGFIPGLLKKIVELKSMISYRSSF
jgi:apoptosis-inducing factor 2